MFHQDIIAALPQDFPSTSKVWIYQSSRRFTPEQQREIDEQLHQFYSQWTAHGAPVKGWAKLLFSQFIVVIADLSQTVVSGCSTDAMEMVIKSIGRQYDTKLFDRLMLTFLVKDEPQMLPLNQVQYAIDKDYIHADTLLFDNTIADLETLKTRWLVPLKDTWLAQKVSFPIAQ
ncbi:MAG: hypothetical protein ABI378_02645 [Chitinophagaceae bacterium]